MSASPEASTVPDVNSSRLTPAACAVANRTVSYTAAQETQLFDNLHMSELVLGLGTS